MYGSFWKTTDYNFYGTHHLVRSLIGQLRIWEELGGNPSPSVKASAEAFPLCLYGVQAPLGLSALQTTMYQKSDTKAYCCTASPGALFFFLFSCRPEGPAGGTTCLCCLSPWPRLILRGIFIRCNTVEAEHAAG